jgi:hypothetical protein
MKAKDAVKALLKKDGDAVEIVPVQAKISPLLVPNEDFERAVSRFEKLRDAVRNLYYSAFWSPDRPITRLYYDDADGVRHYDKEIVLDDGLLWEEVRDAAGFPKGGAPERRSFEGISVQYDLSRLRLLSKLIRKTKSDTEFTSEQAKAFLLLHSTELQDRLDKTIRDFLKEKL